MSTKNSMGSYQKMCHKVFSTFKDSDFFSDKAQHIFFHDYVSAEPVEKLRNDIHNACKLSIETVYVKPKPVVIHVHSPGGDGFLGVSLINWLKEYSVPVCVMVDGFACSAITPFLVSAPYRVMHNLAFVLIHEGSIMPSPFKSMKESEFRFTGRVMDVLTNTYRDVYLQHTKIPPKVLDDMLSRDMFINYKQCLKYRVVDRVLFINQKVVQQNLATYTAAYGDLGISKNPKQWKHYKFNHLFLYANGKTWLKKFHESLNKFTIDVTNKGGIPRPVVLHFNSYVFSDKASFFDIITVMARIALSSVPIVSIVDSNIELVSFLPFLFSHYKFTHNNVQVICDLAEFNLNTKYHHDTISNTQAVFAVIQQLLAPHKIDLRKRALVDVQELTSCTKIT